MNELDALAAARAAVPPMSALARNRGRIRLNAAMAPADPRHGRIRRRRLAVALTFGLVLTAAVATTVVFGLPGTQQTASAATILNNAADALDSAAGQLPRNDQYIYQQVLQLTSAQGPAFHIQSWTAVDGQRQGSRSIRTVDKLSSCGRTPPSSTGPTPSSPGGSAVPSPAGPTPTMSAQPSAPGSTRPSAPRSVGPSGPPPSGAPVTNPCDADRTVIAVYNAKDGLASAPYSVLATLPTDPAALLAALNAGAAPISATPGVAGAGPGISHEVQTWDLIRTLAEVLPSAQCAALFRAAATLKGITVVPSVTDAVGRVGIGVSLYDPRLGTVVIVFDKSTYRYLGEVIFDHNHQVEFSRALIRTAVVNQIGQL